MKKILKFIIFANVLFNVAIFNVLCAADISGLYALPYGKSETYVEIFKRDNKYYALGFANKEGTKAGKDIHNPHPHLRDRELHGTIFMWNLEEIKDGEYANGKIYNNNNGKTYHIKAKLAADALNVVASKDKKGVMGKTLKWRKLTPKEIESLKDKRINTESAVLPKEML